MSGAPSTQLELLRPYLPRLALRWIVETPETLCQEIEGSVAFVDISGFTKLSERLARRGKVGAEELTDAIGTCFTRLLAVAYGNGGSLLKFGGDALLLFFTGDDHETKAARAAFGMRRELRDIGKIDCQGVPVSLRMSVGVHSGNFHFFLVGDSHRELIVTGPAASETVLMESTAEAGEIVVSQSTAAALPTHALGAAKGAGVLLRREPSGMTPDRPERDLQIDGAEVIGYVPAAVRNQLLAGSHDAEHRRVTIAFVHFDGTDVLVRDAGPDAAAECLDALVCDVQRAVDKQGVAFLASDIDRDGGKIILTAGAPASTGNDEERMLLALREIIDAERQIPIRVGVNRGHVFAGDIGPFYRRTYTVMGDAVNLAARLMAKATPGQILSAEGLLDLSRTEFESVALEPFAVKGKARPIKASVVGAIRGARKESANVRIPLIGRDTEVKVLLGGLESARRGEGRLVEIVAEPGLGKSRLLEEVRMHSEDVVVIEAACELYEASTPYGPFRRLLRVLLGIPQEAPASRVVARLREVIEALEPGLLPWAPLVAIALDVEMPDTPETSALQERFRRARLNEVAGDLIAKLIRTPSMFIFEDAHWMDEASADLLSNLVRRVEGLPWFICVTRRDSGEGFVAPKSGATSRLDLQPLDARYATEILTAATEESPLRPDEMASLAERSGGNPLFLRELVAAAKSVGGLEALPDSVEALIMARIDRLAPTDRNLLRRASVLGRSFSPELLIAVLNGETPDATAWSRLTDFLAPDEAGNLGFVHALIRDGAYEGLPYRLRRELHAQVGETIEKRAGDTPDDEAELLSMHFFFAQRYAEAWRYSLVAAERARVIYANVESAGFYGRAIEAAKRIADLTPFEVARVHEALGDVLRMAGDFRAARASYRSARRLVPDRVDEARLALKEARIAERLSRFSDALRWVRRGGRALEGVEGNEAMKQRAELTVWEGVFRQAMGNSREAIRLCERAIIEADSVDDRAVLARAYATLDWAYLTIGQVEDKSAWTALAIYEELGDLVGQAIMLNNLGVRAFTAGRWNEAIDLFERGRAAREKTGDPIAADGTYNIAEILSAQGRLEEAEAMLRQVLRIYRASEYLSGVALAMSELGRLAARAGRYDEATSLLDEAVATFEHIGEKQMVIETKAKIAENLAFQGSAPRALATAKDALAMIDPAEGTNMAAPMLQRIRGYALMQMRSLADAGEAFEQSLSLANASEIQYDVALALRASAYLARCRQTRRDDLEAKSASILARLGVASVVDPPGTMDPGQGATIELDPLRSGTSS